MPSYRRAIAPGGIFFTVCLHDRRRRLLTEHIADLQQVFADARRRRPFRIDAIVILPDHLHCIWTLPEGDAGFSARWHDIKSRFAARVPRDEGLSPRRLHKGERGIWQRRFWEHLILDERDYRNHVDYIHYNPVKHRHVGRVKDWPYSSFHRFVDQGTYPEDWAAADGIRAWDLE